MQASAPEGGDRPFVQTKLARQLLSRIQITHEERGISVFSGPWGIGKTTTINAFQTRNEGCCAVVKVDPGSSKRGATPASVLQLALEALRPLRGRSGRATAQPTSYWMLRKKLFEQLDHFFDVDDVASRIARFTFIFDEAQYLSREAIEMLRFWNDEDRTTTPFPVGLVFVGNNEFSLEEDRAGQSILSGAVRSRALFLEPLDYSDITDQDLVLFAQSRGISDPAAIADIVRYYSAPRIKRDLRTVDKVLATLKRRAKGGEVTGATVQSFLQFA